MKRIAPSLGSLLAVLASVGFGSAVSASGPPLSTAKIDAKTLTPLRLAAAQKTEMPGKLSADRKTILFTQKSVHLVAMTGPDDDMFHSIRFGAWQVRWPSDMTAAVASSVGTLPLPHKSTTALHGTTLTLHATTPGRCDYLCTVRGHAGDGMCGTIIVR